MDSIILLAFSKGGVHKTEGFSWVIFQRGEYTKPMGFDGWFFKGRSTQNRWALMGDFSKGGVHKTEGFSWVIFQRGEYTKPMACDGWFFKGGSIQNRWALMDDFSKGGVHKTDGFWWVIFQRGEYMKSMACDGFWKVLVLLLKLSARGVYFGKYGIKCINVTERKWPNTAGQ